MTETAADPLFDSEVLEPPIYVLWLLRECDPVHMVEGTNVDPILIGPYQEVDANRHIYSSQSSFWTCR